MIWGLVKTQKENSLGCPSQLILWLLEKGCEHGCDLYMHLSMPCTLRSEGKPTTHPTRSARMLALVLCFLQRR